MKLIKLIIPALCLSACASSGIKVDQSKLAQFHKGETTYPEVIQTLGKPSQTMITGNSKIIVYSYFSTQARPETFIPIVGAFAGGADSENSVVTMTFDNNDVLQNLTSSQGSTGTGSGFEAYSQPRTQQPEIVK